MTRRTLARLAATALLVLAVGAACSSGSDDDADTTTTTVAPSDGSDSSGGELSGDPGDGGDTGDVGAEAEGTGVVTLADGEAPAERTVTFSDEGGFDPTTLEVGVGELFTFEATDDGVHAVGFGASTDTYTLYHGLVESFTIDAPGTYTVYEDLSGQTMTITVS